MFNVETFKKRCNHKKHQLSSEDTGYCINITNKTVPKFDFDIDS